MPPKFIYIETYGCSASQNNAEIMKGIMTQAGLGIVSSPEMADICVINTCVVKSPTEEKIRRRIVELAKSKKVIVAGCMPEIRQKELKKIKNVYLLGIHHVKDIAKFIMQICTKNSAWAIVSGQNETKLCLPKISTNRNIGITQISEGCAGNCSFCITRLVKGKLFSYPEGKILQSVQSDLNAGCREIWLTSQDNAAYGMDEGKRKLPELLKSILELKGNCQEPPVKDRWHDNAPLRVVLEHAQNSTSDSNHSLQTSGILTFKVRLGMMNPDNVLPILNELVKIYRHEKMYKFLHIPLQSGSNRILKLMNRSYTTADFMRIISRFKQEIPDITISTDIIAAYPSETNDDFQETLDALKAIKPDVLNISKFWLRKGTAAAEMPKPEQIDAKTAKQRASGLMKLHLRIALENKKMLVGKKIRCLVNDKGFKIHGRQTWLARGDNYELVAIISDNLSSNIKGKSLLGKFIDVRINEAKPHYLVGEKFQQ